MGVAIFFGSLIVAFSLCVLADAVGKGLIHVANALRSR